MINGKEFLVAYSLLDGMMVSKYTKDLVVGVTAQELPR